MIMNANYLIYPYYIWFTLFQNASSVDDLNYIPVATASLTLMHMDNFFKLYIINVVNEGNIIFIQHIHVGQFIFSPT